VETNQNHIAGIFH